MHIFGIYKIRATITTENLQHKNRTRIKFNTNSIHSEVSAVSSRVQTTTVSQHKNPQLFYCISNVSGVEPEKP